MKKIICIIMAIIFVLIPLSSCDSAGADDESQSPSDSKAESNGTSATVSENISDPYSINNSEDERITTKNDKKAFNDGRISFEYPANWKFTEQKVEDGSTVYFSEPELGEDCQLSIYITASELYVRDNTEEEYTTSLSEDYTDVSIKEFTKGKIDGCDGTKVTASYKSNGTQFIRIIYDNVIEGVRLYNFDIVYPEAESETYEKIFDDIIASVKLISQD